MNRAVVIAGGGTGGHIFPGLAVATELLEMNVEVHWLGARRGLEADLVGKRGLPLTLVDIEGIRARSPMAAARAVAQLPKSVINGVRLMQRVQPAVVLGVGGYASAAGVLAAGLLGIPWVLQEQNSVPGWTNRSLAPWADLVCGGFADAQAEFPASFEWSGNPVRSEFFEIGELEPHDPPRLLVLGGSQGSLFLNRVVPSALASLRNAGLEPEVRHQTGGRWFEVVRTAYQDLQLDASIEAFVEKPWEAMADADLVIARSGALTVSELAAAGRGALLIPFAAAAGNHQEHNARSLESAGGAVVLCEPEATPQRVAWVLEELLDHPSALRSMAECTRRMALPDAARRIAKRVLSVGGLV